MACTEAQKAYARRWYAANREKVKAAQKKYYAANKEKHREWSKAWKAANKDRVLEMNAQSRKRHPETAARNSKAGYARRKARLGMDGLRAYMRAIRRQPKYRANNSESQARRRVAGASSESKAKIKAFYLEAQRLTLETGVEHQVDHIVPLRHPLVCGLHNEFNLQVITASENAKKRNKFDVHAYNESLRGIV